MDIYYTKEATDERRQFINIKFQEGPVQEVGINGCHIEDVIDVLVERLKTLNVPPLNSRENSLTITALEEAGNWQMRRRLNRVRQGVEGTYAPHKS